MGYLTPRISSLVVTKALDCGNGMNQNYVCFHLFGAVIMKILTKNQERSRSYFKNRVFDRICWNFERVLRVAQWSPSLKTQIKRIQPQTGPKSVFGVKLPLSDVTRVLDASGNMLEKVPLQQILFWVFNVTAGRAKLSNKFFFEIWN